MPLLLVAMPLVPSSFLLLVVCENDDFLCLVSSFGESTPKTVDSVILGQSGAETG